MGTSETSLALPSVPDRLPQIRWFGPAACVIQGGEAIEIRVGGQTVSRFPVDDLGTRNAVLVQLASAGGFKKGRLAESFGLTSEGLRLIVRQYEAEGLGAVLERRPGGSAPRLSEQHRRILEAAFARGEKAAQAHRRLGRRPTVSLSRTRTLRREFLAAARTRGQAAAPSTSTSTSTSTSAEVAPPSPAPTVARVPAPQLALPSVVTDEAAGEPGSVPVPVPVPVPSDTAPATRATGSETVPDDAEVDAGSERIAPEGGLVQHAGVWMMLSMLAADGLHEVAARRCAEAKADADLEWEPPTAADVALAIDAFAAALALGQDCVEGVRRLETPTGAKLLCHSRVPSPWWVRAKLGAFADTGARLFHLGMAGRYIRGAAAVADAGGPTLFYVDNHLRAYTGQAVLRRGWRMQDKRVRPGCTDYWVHDADGRPVFRQEAPTHDSLAEHLAPIADTLRIALGPKERILLAFDRAGAYPEVLATLRDLGVELVTYERRPYQLLPADAFVGEARFDEEVLRFVETAEKNLGGGRGRVRRIAVRGDDGRQVNLLGVGPSPPSLLIAAMRGRWNQENAFKHGAARWGQNQLDGRRLAHYPPDAIIPNPARRRLDHALRLAYISEGDARCRLAKLDDATSQEKRESWHGALRDAEHRQRELLAERTSTPTHAPLAETELAGKLVYHRPGYKLALDTVRIACQNVEAELALILGERMDRPREAKKLLANLLAAPGFVHASKTALRVSLLPAAAIDEQAAVEHLLDELTRRKLRLPGDPWRRRLVFGSQE